MTPPALLRPLKRLVTIQIYFFVGVSPYSFQPKRSFSVQNNDLFLLNHQGWLGQCQAGLISDGTFARPNGVTTLLGQKNLTVDF